MAAHSILGASGAHRWMACPGSIRLTKDLPSTSSSYAMLGTAAHALGEKCLGAGGKDPSEFLGEVIEVEGQSFTVDDDMVDAVRVYVQAVMGDIASDDDVLAIEQRFDLGLIKEGMFGTNDASVFKRKEKLLIIYDYKHGQGHVVEVENNPQLKYYALGRILAGRVGIPNAANVAKYVEQVQLVVVQPRAPHVMGPVRRWTMPVGDLIAWIDELKAAAEATEKDDAPLNAGDHCQFCAAAGTCPALRQKSLEAVQASFRQAPMEWEAPDPETLTKEQIAAILKRAELVKDWVQAVQSHAHTLAESGHEIPGFKLVARRASRKYKNPKLAKIFAQACGLSDQDILTEPELKSVAQLEKVLPRDKREAFNKKFVVKESSGTNLVQDTDARPEVLSAVQRAFAPVNQPERSLLPWEM